MEKMTLALLCGGVSSEREVSLNSGNQVYEALDKDKYQLSATIPQPISRVWFKTRPALMQP